MTRLLLHVGHPKTGTTALQSVLSANAKTLLDKASVLYPTQTTPTKIKHALAIPWLLGLEYEAVRRAAHANEDQLLEVSKAYWESITNEINSKKASSIILSAEGFWILRKAAADKRIMFRQTMASIASHISVAGYLKSPASYFTSMINQKLRNFRDVSLPSPEFYRGSIEAWESLGFDAYSWRIFDRKYLVNGDIVDDFCAQNLTHSMTGLDLKRDGIEDANASVSNEALVILEDLAEKHPDLKQNIYDHRRYKIVDILRETDAEIGGDCRPALTSEAKAGMISRCKDLAWLRDRGLSFPDIDPDLIGAANEYSPKAFTKVSDFCPIDTDRLDTLRSTANSRIDQLFASRRRRLPWPFRRLSHKQN
jgi:hypothetical protein